MLAVSRLWLVFDFALMVKKDLSTLAQGFSTPGPRTGNGPWLNQYRAAQELISYFCFIYYLSLGQ